MATSDPIKAIIGRERGGHGVIEDGGHMIRTSRRRTRAASVIGGVVIGLLLLPASVNIITGSLPDAWKPYEWWALPVALILATVLVLIERRSTQTSETELPEDDKPWQNVQNSVATGQSMLFTVQGGEQRINYFGASTAGHQDATNTPGEVDSPQNAQAPDSTARDDMGAE